ncbi:MAG: hypothetical protein LBN92_02630 [Treponema sp.]|jgi:5-deoxy-glucuronate isomerase|nr:hypothetical protein [Treponema sp.]
MQIHHKPPFARGYTELVPRRGVTADMLMDFGVVRLLAGETWESESAGDEQCWLLAEGGAALSWEGKGGAGSKEMARGNLCA